MVLLVAGMWWLSGWDAHVTGENKKRDIIRRVVRCAISAIFIGSFYFGTLAAGKIMVIPVALALLWCGPIAEMVSHKFNKLLGTAGSDVAFEKDKSVENMEVVANLIQAGRHEEALELYETLEESGDANVAVLETLLDRAGIPHKKFKQPKPLLDAGQLRTQGKFAEAEQILKSLLEQNPSNTAAPMMLMRLYVQDFKRSDKAMDVLRALQRQPHIPAAQIEYAQRSIHDWGQKKVEEIIELPETVEELLAAGYFGTAIDMLEKAAAEQPDNFEAQLKLAEAYGLHSRDISKAKKIIEKLEKKSIFTDAQIQTAKAKLEEWREAKIAK